jgi:hypothetical protein
MANFFAELKRRQIYRAATGCAVLAWYGQALALDPDDSDVQALRPRKRLCGVAQ